MQKVGLFGGAFDPIHKGHIHIAKLAQEKLDLDKVVFIPLYQAVHKNQPVLSLEERINAVKKSIENYPGFVMDLDEIERKGSSYTIDTVQNFIKKHTSDLSHPDLYYIIGADAFELFFTWKDPYTLLELVKFIVIARPGYGFAVIEKMFSAQENQKYLDRLFLIEDEGINISSTMIREQMNADNN